MMSSPGDGQRGLDLCFLSECIGAPGACDPQVGHTVLRACVTLVTQDRRDGCLVLPRGTEEQARPLTGPCPCLGASLHQWGVIRGQTEVSMRVMGVSFREGTMVFSCFHRDGYWRPGLGSLALGINTELPNRCGLLRAADSNMDGGAPGLSSRLGDAHVGSLVPHLPP